MIPAGRIRARRNLGALERSAQMKKIRRSLRARGRARAFAITLSVSLVDSSGPTRLRAEGLLDPDDQTVVENFIGLATRNFFACERPWSSGLPSLDQAGNIPSDSWT